MGKAAQDYFVNPMLSTAKQASGAVLSPLTEEQRKAREQAEQLAAQQREALAKLKAEETPVIPVADEVAKAARRRSISDQLRRRGRASTILTGNTGPSDPLGS